MMLTTRRNPGNGQVVRSCNRGYALVHVLTKLS
jgi:hypothetical protein